MYSTPKAAHFTAYWRGAALPDYHRGGIQVRWDAAKVVEALGVYDMLGLKPDTVKRIEDALKKHPWPDHITVSLNEVWGGTPKAPAAKSD